MEYTLSIFLNILSIITVVVILFLGFYVYRTDRKKTVNKFFLFLCVSIIFWIVTVVLRFSTEIELTALFYARLTFAAATLTGYGLFAMAIYFPIVTIKNKYIFKLFGVITLIVFFLQLTPFSVKDIEIINGVQQDTYGFAYLLFNIYFLASVLLYFIILYLKKKKLDPTEKVKVNYLMYGFLLTAIIAFSTNIIIPYFTDVTIVALLGPLSSVFIIIFTFIAIIKHHLFNIKVVITELVVFALWVFIVTRMLFSDGTEFIIDVVVTILFSVFGVMLIKGVYKEVHTREQLAVANKKLQRLNLEKSEFLSLASHQLKSPLAVIKGYSSMLMEGTYGKFEPKIIEVLSRIFGSAENLVIIIDDFLNISRIEQGRMKYDFGPVDMKKLATDITADLKQVSEKSETEISFSAENPDDDYTITADYGKIRQVITNLVDNAIKYTGKGYVKISITKNQTTHTILLTIKDNGIGMSKETVSKLFQRFSRAKNIATKAQTKSGSGLGLYIAREMVLAHGGRVWAESAGEGKGSIFLLELPFHPPEQEEVETDISDEKKKT